MGQFLCRVADAEGRVFSQVEPATSLEEARQKLVERGLYVYSVESRGGRLAGLLRQRSGRQIGGSEFVILNQQFNTLIKAGLPILKSLDLLASRATAPKLRPVISQIRAALPRLERGAPCPHAFVDRLDGGLPFCFSRGRGFPSSGCRRHFSLVPYGRRWSCI